LSSSFIFPLLFWLTGGNGGNGGNGGKTVKQEI
jgi:hypothetical protein